MPGISASASTAVLAFATSGPARSAHSCASVGFALGRFARRGNVTSHTNATPSAPPVVNVRQLPNSIKICYPTFRDHIPTREALLAHSAELFALIRDGRLTIEIGGRYPLAEAARAHRDLESRATTGKLLLLP